MNQRLLNLFIHYLFIKTYAHEFHPAQKKNPVDSFMQMYANDVQLKWGF